MHAGKLVQHDCESRRRQDGIADDKGVVRAMLRSLAEFATNTNLELVAGALATVNDEWSLNAQWQGSMGGRRFISPQFSTRFQMMDDRVRVTRTQLSKPLTALAEVIAKTALARRATGFFWVAYMTDMKMIMPLNTQSSKPIPCSKIRFHSTKPMGSRLLRRARTRQPVGIENRGNSHQQRCEAGGKSPSWNRPHRNWRARSRF